MSGWWAGRGLAGRSASGRPGSTGATAGAGWGRGPPGPRRGRGRERARSDIVSVRAFGGGADAVGGGGGLVRAGGAGGLRRCGGSGGVGVSGVAGVSGGAEFPVPESPVLVLPVGPVFPAVPVLRAVLVLLPAPSPGGACASGGARRPGRSSAAAGRTGSAGGRGGARGTRRHLWRPRAPAPAVPATPAAPRHLRRLPRLPSPACSRPGRVRRVAWVGYHRGLLGVVVVPGAGDGRRAVGSGGGHAQYAGGAGAGEGVPAGPWSGEEAAGCGVRVPAWSQPEYGTARVAEGLARFHAGSTSAQFCVVISGVRGGGHFDRVGHVGGAGGGHGGVQAMGVGRGRVGQPQVDVEVGARGAGNGPIGRAFQVGAAALGDVGLDAERQPYRLGQPAPGGAAYTVQAGGGGDGGRAAGPRVRCRRSRRRPRSRATGRSRPG